jgi:hypothetical protein
MHSENRIDRRTFVKVSGGALALGLTPAPDLRVTPKLPATPANEARYPAKWYEFTEHPDSDTCWSLSVGPDGRIQRDQLDYLFDLAEKVQDPPDSGRATQCKIHYSIRVASRA